MVFGNKPRSRGFSSDVQRPQNTTMLIPQDDGSTVRMSSEIPYSKWHEIGKYITQYKPDNFKHEIFDGAFPNMEQAKRRILRDQMIGFLLKNDINSEYNVNYLSRKGNTNVYEIVYPDGFIFFSHLSRGLVSPLVKLKIPYDKLPHSPLARSMPKKRKSTQHTRNTQAETGG